MLFQKEPGKVEEKAIRAFKELDDTIFMKFKTIFFYSQLAKIFYSE